MSQNKGGAQLQERLVASTHQCLDRAGTLFGRRFDYIPIHFDLRGAVAGRYQRRYFQASIHYNPWIAANDYAAFAAETVPHEVAHYIVDMLYPRRRLQPHGREWKQVMAAFGIEKAASRHQFDLSGILLRRQKRFRYSCRCFKQQHWLSTTRHKRVLEGARYICRNCDGILQWDGCLAEGDAVAVGV